MSDSEMDNATLTGPPDGFEFVLLYLDTCSRLNVATLNKFFQEAMQDPFLWRKLAFDWRISGILSNRKLLRFVDKACGRLKSLQLMYASRITNETLDTILKCNLQLETLSVPGCTRLDAEKLVRAVEDHCISARANGFSGIKHLNIFWISTFSSEHVARLEASVRLTDWLSNNGSTFYRYYGYKAGYFWGYSEGIDKRPVDVELCPKCRKVTLAFDCPNFKNINIQERDSTEYENWVYSLTHDDCNHYVSCRGCLSCIPRCVECGICIRLDLYRLRCQENKTICGDLLCARCITTAPKCPKCKNSTCSFHEKVYFTHSQELKCIKCLDHDGDLNHLFSP